MTLQITLTQSEVALKLLQTKGRVDLETAKYYHDLSDVLITRLDKLLLKTNIDIKSLKSYKIRGNLGKDSTSYKIAAAFVEGLKI
jgi:hypothetical protein